MKWLINRNGTKCDPDQWQWDVKCRVVMWPPVRCFKSGTRMDKNNTMLQSHVMYIAYYLSCPSCARCVSLIDQYLRDVPFGVFSFSITMGRLFTKYRSAHRAISGSEVICRSFLVIQCLLIYKQTPYSVMRASSWTTLFDVSINTWFLDQFRCFLDQCLIPRSLVYIVILTATDFENYHHGSISDTLFAMLLFDQSMALVFSFVTITKDIVFCVCLVLPIQFPRNDWHVKTNEEYSKDLFSFRYHSSSAPCSAYFVDLYAQLLLICSFATVT